MTTQAVSDERLAKVGLARRLFQQPEIGAVIGAVVVWLFFAFFAPEN